MRILVDGATISRGGGVAVYVKNIVRNFSSRNEIVVLVKDKKSASFFSDKKNVRTAVMPFHSVFTRIFYEQLIIPVYALVIKADALFLPKQYAPLLRTSKIISTVHDFVPDKRVSGENFLTRIYWSLQYNFIRRRSDGIVFPALLVRDEYEKRFKNLGRKKSAYIPDGFDNYKKRDNQKEEFILIPSTIKKRKNIKLSLELALLMRKDYPDKKIVVFGREDSKKIILDIKKNYKDIEFLGYVSDGRAEQLFNDAFIVLYLSSREGYGLPIAEAISLKKRVVAAKTKLNKSIYTDMPIYYNLERTLKENYPSISNKLKEGVKYEEKTRGWKDAGEETELFIESVVR